MTSGKEVALGPVADPSAFKTCTKCARTRHTEIHFHRDSRTPGKHLARCKDCIRANDRARRPAKYPPRPPKEPKAPRIPRDAGGVQMCTRCKKTYPATLEHFQKKAVSTNGLTSWCRPCHRDYARERQAARRADPVERERVRAEKQRWIESDKGREWKRARSQIDNLLRQGRTASLPWDWSIGQWEECLRFFVSTCAYCGSADDLTQDHVIPVADPACPGTVPWNMVPACGPCNYSKQHRDVQAWCKDEQRLAVVWVYVAAQRRAQRHLAA